MAWYTLMKMKRNRTENVEMETSRRHFYVFSNFRERREDLADMELRAEGRVRDSHGRDK